MKTNRKPLVYRDLSQPRRELPADALVIGIVGHQDLRPTDVSALRETAIRQLQALTEKAGKRSPLLLTTLAPGAELLVAELVAGPNQKLDGFGLAVVLPVPELELPQLVTSKQIDQDTFNRMKSLIGAATLVIELNVQGELAGNERYEVGCRDAAKFVVEQSDYLLALWDGVKASVHGHPSEPIYHAIERGRLAQARDKRRIPDRHVRQIFTPHLGNPCPVRRAFTVQRHFPAPQRERILRGRRDLRWWGTPQGLSMVIAVFIAMTTTVLGTIGILDYYRNDLKEPVDFGDAVLRAAGLPLLNNMDLPRRFAEGGETSGKLLPLPVTLEMARWTGLLFFPSAIVVGLAFYFNERLRYRTIRRWMGTRGNIKKRYAIVGGLGWKGWELTLDLLRQGYKVAVIEKNPLNPSIQAVQDKGGLVFEGDCVDSKLLDSLLPHRASKIFLVTGNEEVNIRAASAIGELVEANADHRLSHRVDCHLDVTSPDRLALVEASADGKSAFALHTFNTEESTARALLERHPIDRFSTLPGNDRSIEVVILGDKPIAQAILNVVLRSSEYGNGSKVTVTVMTAKPKESAIAFRETFPVYAFSDGQKRMTEPQGTDSFLLEPVLTWERINTSDQWAINPGPAPEDPDAPARYIAPEQSVLPSVRFCLLPQSDGLLLGDGCPIFSSQEKGATVSFYVCIDDGPVNAAYLRRFIPKLNRVRLEKECDTQVFYYFTSPERDLPEDFDRMINRIGGSVPIIAFGDFLYECSVEAVEATHLDIMAKLVNYSFTKGKAYLPGVMEDKSGNSEVGQSITYSPQPRSKGDFATVLKEAEEAWARISEDDRKSSRMSADHIDIKLRTIGWDLADESQDWSPHNPAIFQKLYTDLMANHKAKLKQLSVLEHRRWCADRLLQGFRWWRLRNKDAKEHPDLVIWDHLSPKERDKDPAVITAIPQFLIDQRMWLDDLAKKP